MAERRLILIVMCAGLFLVQLDVSIVNVALPSIRADLRPSAAGLQWVVDGYAIALASLMLAGGLLVAGPGWRWVFLVNLPVVAAAAVLTARLVRESADPRGRRLDIPGIALGAVALAAATVAVIDA